MNKVLATFYRSIYNIWEKPLTQNFNQFQQSKKKEKKAPKTLAWFSLTVCDLNSKVLTQVDVRPGTFLWN